MANRAQGWAVFVHGCFWHGHPSCRLATSPKTNRAFWTEKIAANRKRDARKVAALRAAGLRVLTVWQCETRDEGRLCARLRRTLTPA